MLLLLAIATSSPPVPAKAVATASVRIERPASASERDWEKLPKGRRRELIVRDEQGRDLLLRLIENE
jgi:hypothetical protein